MRLPIREEAEEFAFICERGLPVEPFTRCKPAHTLILSVNVDGWPLCGVWVAEALTDTESHFTCKARLRPRHGFEAEQVIDSRFPQITSNLPLGMLYKPTTLPTYASFG